MLADTSADRRKLRDTLVPGSQTQLYLQILDTLKSLQENPADRIPGDLHSIIETYGKKYGYNQQMFKLREKLLRYDRED